MSQKQKEIQIKDQIPPDYFYHHHEKNKQKPIESNHLSTEIFKSLLQHGHDFNFIFLNNLMYLYGYLTDKNNEKFNLMVKNNLYHKNNELDCLPYESLLKMLKSHEISNQEKYNEEVLFLETNDVFNYCRNILNNEFSFNLLNENNHLYLIFKTNKMVWNDFICQKSIYRDLVNQYTFWLISEEVLLDFIQHQIAFFIHIIIRHIIHYIQLEIEQQGKTKISASRKNIQYQILLEYFQNILKIKMTEKQFENICEINKNDLKMRLNHLISFV